MSVNHVVTNYLPHHDCMRRGADALIGARLQHFGTTSEAVWGRTYDNRYTAVVYCLTTRDVAVLAVTGFDRSVTHNLVEDLLASWHRTR